MKEYINRETGESVFTSPLGGYRKKNPEGSRREYAYYSRVHIEDKGIYWSVHTHRICTICKQVVPMVHFCPLTRLGGCETTKDDTEVNVWQSLH